MPDASIRMVDDESRARVSFIGTSPESRLVGPARILRQFWENLLATWDTWVPEFPPCSRFENRKLEQAAVSSLSSPECDEVL